MVTITCSDGYVIPPDFTLGDKGDGYYLTPSSTDPIASLLASFNPSLLKLPETLITSRVTFAYPLFTAATAARFQNNQAAYTCTIASNTNAAFKLVNAGGEQIAFPFTVGFVAATCNLAAATALSNTVQSIAAYAKNASSIDQIFQMQAALGLFTFKEAYTTCTNYIQQLVTFGNKTIAVPPTSQCLYRRNDAGWITDPCCNQGLSQSQCCMPKSGNRTVNFVQSVQTSMIAQSCKSPAAVTALVFNAATAANNNDGNVPDFGGAYSTASAFIQVCQNLVFNTACTLDSDCVYSGKCGQGGTCYVDYTNVGPPLIGCYVAKMSSDLRTQFSSDLGLPPSYDTTAHQVGNLTNAILAVSSSVDCAGPTGNLYHSNTTYAKDPTTGNYASVFTAGDQVGCLRDTQCNYQPWSRKTSLLCTQDSLTGFCAQNQNGFNNSISNPNTCTLSFPYQDPAFTATVNGASAAMIAVCTGKSGNVRGSNGYYQCFLDTLTASASACYADTTVLDTTRTDNYRSSQSICYGGETSGTCTAVGTYWSNGLNACVHNVAYAACISGGFSFSPGRVYSPGQYASAATCPSSTCSFMSSSITDIGNSTQCAAAAFCSQPCSRCRTYRYPNGACVDTSIMTRAACTGGDWNGATGVSTGTSACVLSSITQAQCSTGSQTWIDTSAATTSALCSAVPQGIQAQWNQYDSCANQAACLSGGQCDDYEFGSNSQVGACVITAVTPFQCSNGRSQTRAGNCIDNTVSTSAACTGVNSTWVVRANSQATCMAQGSKCVMPNGQQIYINTTACAVCGGTSSSIYRWQAPVWQSGKMLTTNWISPVQMQPINQLVNSLDWMKLQNLLQKSVSKILMRNMMNAFNKQ